MRCLRKDPARRFQTMADLKVALQEVREEAESGQLAEAVPPHRRAAAALALRGSRGSGRVLRGSGVVDVAHGRQAVSVTPAAAQTPAIDAGHGRRPSRLSPDGNGGLRIGSSGRRWAGYLGAADDSRCAADSPHENKADDQNPASRLTVAGSCSARAVKAEAYTLCRR
jgi:hypothetical protein